MKDLAFSFIVDTIIKTLTTNWVYAQLEFEVMPGYSSYHGKYKMSPDDPVTSLPADKFPGNFSTTLKEKFASDNKLQNVWNKGKVVCYPSGEFDVELMWDEEVI